MDQPTHSVLPTHRDRPVDLPEFLAPFFWDCDWETISWEKHASFVIRRILQAGDWQSIRWLRSQMGDEALRNWLVAQGGGGLSPRQLRYWGLVLSIHSGTVTRWIHKTLGLPWEARLVR